MVEEAAVREKLDACRQGSSDDHWKVGREGNLDGYTMWMKERTAGEKILAISAEEAEVLWLNGSLLIGGVGDTSKFGMVVGWRLVESDEGMKLQCTWRVRNYGCGIELISRIYEALEVSGHYPDLHLEQPNQLTAELRSTTIGGLSLNDFIVAAKIDMVKTLDLVPKKRIWA
ncbi:probable pterin-4-alpha-carbinolamine dehydratase, chloroplastic [Dendrobium catenatum]|uniref:probable pterin-4-alpha-carbinolamine dehydratase, chloroplastic n=1 Tax=Dendrobium catenatum TaxID=906689 RepID=UPI0009F5432C|nr:probable pterin-4-alpha-carbinolamine dehydratase, chloroplastic [Dendrobium catenatum]